MNHKPENDKLKGILTILFAERTLAICSVILLAISLVMPIYVGFFNYASGDDLLYGAILRNGFRHGDSIGVLEIPDWKQSGLSLLQLHIIRCSLRL